MLEAGAGACSFLPTAGREAAPCSAAASDALLLPSAAGLAWAGPLPAAASASGAAGVRACAARRPAGATRASAAGRPLPLPPPGPGSAGPFVAPAVGPLAAALFLTTLTGAPAAWAVAAAALPRCPGPGLTGCSCLLAGRPSAVALPTTLTGDSPAGNKAAKPPQHDSDMTARHHRARQELQPYFSHGIPAAAARPPSPAPPTRHSPSSPFAE